MAIFANQLINIAMKTALQINTEELVKSLSRYDYPSFNHVPAHGGWTPGEVAEHLLLFDIRINGIFSGKAQATNRDPQEKIEAIVERLSNMETKLEAPAFLLPSPMPKDPKAILEKLLVQRAQLLQLCRDQDMNLEYPDSPHQVFGPLTGVEWINFLILHTDRHLNHLAKAMRQK